VKAKTSVLAVFACFLWSTAFAGVKIGLEFFNPLALAGIRFIISGLILLPFCGGLVNIKKIFSENKKVILLISFFQIVMVYTLFYRGMTMVTGSSAAVIIGASPLISAVMAHFTIKDDPLTLKKFLFILTGLTGVVIITFGTKGAYGFSGRYLGVALLLLSSISGAAGNIVVAKSKKRINPFVMNAVQIFIGGCTLLAVSFLFEGVPLFKGLPAKFWISLFWLSTVSAAGFSIWFNLLQRQGVKVSELNLWKFVIPVFGAVLSWIILPDENPNLITIIGMFAVSASIIAYSICNKKKGYAFYPRT